MEFNPYPSQFYDYNVHSYLPSLHWCSRWSYSMPHTQINTMSDQLLAIQENLTRVLVQVESAKSSYSRWSGLMASISNQIQELISEESSLVHSPSLSDCLEHFDENVESDLEDELLNCVDKVFDGNSQRDVTNSLAPIVAIELSLVSSTVSRGSNFSSGTTQNLHPPKVAIAISSSNVELAYKLFDTPSDMELFAHSYDPNTPIASLPLDIGSRNCKWVDTGQVGGSLYLDVKLFHRFCDILGMSPYLLAKYARKLFVELSDMKIFEVSHGVLHLCNELCEATRNVAEISYATSPEASIGPTFLNASIGFGGFCFPKDILHLSCICECNSILQYMFLHLPFDPGLERLPIFADFTTSIPYDILDEETLLLGFVIVDFAQFLRAAPFHILPSATGDLSNSIADFVNHSQSLFTIAEFYICSNEIRQHNIFQLSGVENNGYFTTCCAAYKLLGESIDIFLMYSFAGAPTHIGKSYIIDHLRHFSCGLALDIRQLYHALSSKTVLWVNDFLTPVLVYVTSSQMVGAKLLLAMMLLQFEDIFCVLYYAREFLVLNELEGSVETQYPFENSFKHIFLLDQLKLLKGASLVVQHFHSTSFEINIPVFIHLRGLWNISFLGHPSRTKLTFFRTLERDKKLGQLPVMAFYLFDAPCIDKLGLKLEVGSSTNEMLASSIGAQHARVLFSGTAYMLLFRGQIFEKEADKLNKKDILPFEKHEITASLKRQRILQILFTLLYLLGASIETLEDNGARRCFSCYDWFGIIWLSWFYPCKPSLVFESLYISKCSRFLEGDLVTRITKLNTKYSSVGDATTSLVLLALKISTEGYFMVCEVALALVARDFVENVLCYLVLITSANHSNGLWSGQNCCFYIKFNLAAEVSISLPTLVFLVLFILREDESYGAVLFLIVVSTNFTNDGQMLTLNLENTREMYFASVGFVLLISQKVRDGAPSHHWNELRLSGNNFLRHRDEEFIMPYQWTTLGVAMPLTDFGISFASILKNQANTFIGCNIPDPNLEDKVLIEGGGIVTNMATIDLNYHWDPDDFKWLQRVNTALALAILLNFLHERKSPYLIRNFHPSHIVVDQNFTPILFDFGMLTGGVCGCQIVESDIELVDRLGFMDPSFAWCVPGCGAGAWSVKSDVYAFGVLLLNLMSKRVTDKKNVKETLVGRWALKEYQPGRSLVDTSLQNDPNFDSRDGPVMTDLARQSIDDKQVNRPLMKVVVKRLEALHVVQQ